MSVIMVKSFVVNFILIIIKIIAGILFYSTALIADAIHSISDLLTDIFVIIGIRHSAKPPDEEHPIGHGKFEYVLSIFLGFGIAFLAYQLIYSMVTNFNDAIIIPRVHTLIVVVFVIISKLILSKYLLIKGKYLNSQIIIASGKESLTDVISSIVVFVGVFTAIIGNALNIPLLQYGDKIAGLIVALLIIKIALEIIYDNVQHILGKSADDTTLKTTEDIIKSVEGVKGVDSLNMIAYGHYYQVLVKIRVDGKISVKSGHDIAGRVKRILEETQKISHVIIHVNPEE